MINFDNMLTQTHLPPTQPYHGLNPASGAENASDNRRERDNPSKNGHTAPEENEPENDTLREYAPITPSSGGIIRRHIPLQEAVTYIDGGEPNAALRRRAKEYERMMLFH